MRHSPKKLRPLVKTHGGKAYLARRIIALFPDHDTYVEPFAGGLSVLLNKPESVSEIANDLNSGLIRTYRALRNYPDAVVRELTSCEYDEDVFNLASLVVEKNDTKHDVDWAVAFIVKNRFSRGGLGEHFAWSDRLRGGQPGDVNAWKTIVAESSLIARRIEDVSFSSIPAVDVIKNFDKPTTLVYADPPYFPDTRSSPKVYDHEMTADDHAELLNILRCATSKVFLSGYRNPFYDSALSGWRRFDFDMPNHSGQGKTKQRRIESVWTNT